MWHRRQSFLLSGSVAPEAAFVCSQGYIQGTRPWRCLVTQPALLSAPTDVIYNLCCDENLYLKGEHDGSFAERLGWGAYHHRVRPANGSLDYHCDSFDAPGTGGRRDAHEDIPDDGGCGGRRAGACQGHEL